MPGGRPNLLLLLTDQQRADFFAREGLGIDTMPRLEAAAAPAPAGGARNGA